MEGADDPRGINPWLRLLAVAVAVVVGALLLKVLPPIIVLALFVGGVAYVNARLKPSSSKRSKPSVADARVLGFQRSPTDPFGLVGYPLSLFSRGLDGQIVDVVWGSWRRLDVKVFEYRSVDGSGDAAPTRRFACALGAAPAGWPALSIEPEAFLTPAAERGPMRAVRLGDAFEARFDVRSDDEPFARQLLDQAVRDWMLASADPWGFEVNGRLVLAYRPAEDPVPTTEALEALGGFLDRIPKALQHGVQT